MAWRMLRYLSYIRLAYPSTRVRQHLIYIGKDGLNMPAGIGEEDIRYSYGVLDMRQVDCAHLLSQDNPDALVLAVLCDFRNREPRAVVHHIFARLQELLGDNPKRFREYLDMLEILSDNRNLKEYIKEAENMLTRVDVTKLPSFELGMEAGYENGMEKGMEKGVEKGIERGAHLEKLRMAKGLLDLLPDEVIAEKTGLPPETIRGLRDGEE